jgi:hypothetical protein
MKLLTQPVVFAAFQSIGGPVVTPEGLGISLILMIPSAAALLRRRVATK